MTLYNEGNWRVSNQWEFLNVSAGHLTDPTTLHQWVDPWHFGTDPDEDPDPRIRTSD